MSNESQIFQLLKELRDGHLDMQKSLGRLEAGQSNLTSYVGAVSANGKALEAKLELHRDDTDAHGMKAVRRAFSGIATLITVAISVLEGMRYFKK